MIVVGLAGATYLIAGVAILIAILREGSTERYHLGHYALVVVAGPAVIAMLLAQGLIDRNQAHS